MTHSSQAGLASFQPPRINPADLVAAKAAAWDEGYRARFLDGDYATNPYRTKEDNA